MTFALVMAVAAALAPAGPPYSVALDKLEAGLHCPASFPRADNPVVLLVHGTSLTDEENWSWNYAKALPAAGFDVCTVLLPERSLEDIQPASEYVVYGIREIARRSGRKVSLVGVSQGAIQPRWALKWWPDTREVVEDYVSMAGTNHGSLYGNAGCSPSCAPAIWQQRQGSTFLTALNADDETPGDLSYTSVYSLTDPIIQPVAPEPTAAIDGASNVAVQDICPGRPVDHIQSIWDAVYYAVVMDALTHDGPADQSRIDAAVCTQLAMPGVSNDKALSSIAEVYVLAARVQAEHRRVTAEPELYPYARGDVVVVPAPEVQSADADRAAAPAPSASARGGSLAATGAGPDGAALALVCFVVFLFARRVNGARR